MRYGYIVAIILIIVAFAVGRYLSPKSTSTTESQVKEVTARHTVVVKEGGKEVTTIDEHIIDTEVVKKNRSVVIKRPALNVSVLGGVTLTRGSTIIYGLSVSKEIAGPITTGLFGLSNGTLGLSIGLNF